MKKKLIFLFLIDQKSPKNQSTQQTRKRRRLQTTQKRTGNEAINKTTKSTVKRRERKTIYNEPVRERQFVVGGE